MRPYMLWLTRVYAGESATNATAFLGWPNVVSDWARRLREHDYRSEYALRSERSPYELAFGPWPHKSKPTENRSLLTDRRAARRRARAAGQGGR